MHKQIRNTTATLSLSLSLIFVLFTFFSISSADETLTITTYYPSPYGSYNVLYVYSNLGIGITAPNAKLEVNSNTAGTAQLRLSNVNGPSSNYWDIGRDNVSTGDLLFLSGGTEKVRLTGVNGNVGIGTTGPAAPLHVIGTSAALANSTTGIAFIGTGTSKIQFGYDTSTTPGYGWITATKNSSTWSNLVLNPISGTGSVGIGTTNPTYQLQLSTDSAGKLSTNTWTITSDRRVKKDIRPYTNGLSIIKRINPVWFKYNGKAGFPDDNQYHIGVIGQEIIKVAPYTVNTFKAKLNPDDKQETELLNFNSHALTFDLINAVKEQQAQIETLKKEIEKLKSLRK